VASVEPELELVEVGGEMLGAHGALIGPEEHAVEQREDSVDGGERLVSRESAGADVDGHVLAPLDRLSLVGPPTVGETLVPGATVSRTNR